MATTRAKEAFERKFYDDDRYVKDLQSPWVFFVPKRKPGTSSAVPLWKPKLYVCVGAPGYWRTVERLVEAFAGDTHWKFFMGPSGYDRPDKIVFYGRTVAHLRRIVRKVRPLLPKSGFHELHHTGSTVDLGLEKPGMKGMYVGLDLPFRESWRFYRSFCVAWANWNEAYLASQRGGRARWFARMNLSERHEGPLSLEPPASDVAHVKRYWKLIHP